MQFLTVRESKQGKQRGHPQTWKRGLFFAFDFQIEPDPTSEELSIAFATDAWDVCPQEFRPDVATGVQMGCEIGRELGRRLCCTRFTMTAAFTHDVDTSSRGVQLRVASSVRAWMEELAGSVEPLSSDWLTTDVIALAKGIRADSATDRYPILSDALRDAGCEDPLIHDHLQLCPDHGPNCWIVEMILQQAKM